MAKNPNVALSVNTSNSKSELKALTDELKTVKKEFDVSNLAIQATGSALDIASNKIAGYRKQAELQRTITNQIKETIEQANRAYSDAGQRVENARLAFERANKSENTSATELNKLNKELESARNTYSKLEKYIQTWNNKLLDSEKAENKLKVAVKEGNDSIDKQNKELTQHVNNARNVTTASGQMYNVFNLIRGLAVGYAGKTLYEALIGDNAKFEQYMASFDVLLGSADKAKQEMNMLTKFAADTPFELPDLVEAEKRLLAYGVAAKDTQKTLQMLGDISMGSADKLNLISLAYGQTIAKGKLTGEELRQYAENGVPLLDELAKMYGKTTAEMQKMIENGQIGVPAVTQAMDNMTSVGGKFYNMMEKQSKTMNGLLSTLRDNFKMFARDVGDESFEYLKNELSSLMDELSVMSENGELGDIASSWGKNVAKFTEFVVDAVKTLWNMKEALEAAGIALAAFKVAMSIGSIIQTVVSALETYNIAVKAGTTFTAAFTTALNANPWVLLASAIAAVVAAVISYNLITNKSTSQTQQLQDGIKSITDSYNSATQAAQKSADAEIAKLNSCEKLIPELETLSEKTDRSQEENARLNTIISQLNSAMPDLALAIDNETGALNRQISTIYDAVSAYKDLAKAKAVQSMLEETEKTKLQLAEKREELSKTGGEEAERFLEARAKAFEHNNPLANYLSDEDAAKFSDGYFKDIKNSLDSLDSQINELDEKSNNYAESLSELQAKKQEVIDELKSTSQSNSYTAPPLLSGGSSDKSAQREAEQAAREAEQAQKEAIQKEFDDLKFYKDMEYITEDEYYERLAELRDTYYEAGSKEWQQYTVEIKQYNDQQAEKELKARQDEYKARLQDSKNWIAEQKELSNLSVDDEIAAYERIRAYTEEYYNDGVISYQEYADQIETINKSIANAQKSGFEARRTDSNNWITDQKFYSSLSPEDEIAAYKRVKAYVEQYHADGIISETEYQEQIRELDKNIYSTEKSYLEDSIKSYEDAEKKKLEASKEAAEEAYKSEKESYDKRKKAIEEYYDSIDTSEKQQERSKKLTDLRKQEEIYKEAATDEGMKKLKSIRDDIESLNKEAEKDQREFTKKAQIAELDKELEASETERSKKLKDIESQEKNLESAQESLLNKVSEYIKTATGTMEEAIKRAKGILDSAVTKSNNQNSGSGSSGNTNNQVIYYDYGNKTYAGADDMSNYGSEIVSGANNALRAGGG